MLLSVVVSGCIAPATTAPPAAVPGTVPPPAASGEYYREVPGPILPGDCSEFTIVPQETAATVGTEVILVASVRGQDQYMLTNQRVEWTIMPGGVGAFVDFNRATLIDYLVGDFTRPRKVNEHFVITSTTRQYLRLTRGTVDPNDDVIIRPGQAWVSLTSPVEGTSVVQVYVPCVHSWNRRVQTATIHWVDAEWTLPPPAIVPAGSRHKLVTTVIRQRDRSPCSGWKVRYEITGGVTAAFAPEGSTSVEVPVDSSGQAAAEIFQTQPLGGSTQISVQIIRPGDAPGAAGKQLLVASGQTLVTWSAAQLSVRVNAPPTVAAGGSTTVRIEVNNPGDLPAENVIVTATLPSGFTPRSTTPVASVTGNTLTWSIGRLNAHEMRTLDVVIEAAQGATGSLCAEAQGAGGLRAQHCATISAGTAAPATSPTTGTVELRVQGPDRATVGQEVTFVISITNRGTAPLGNLLVKDTFDRGLQHAVAQGAVERDLPGTLQPGETKTIGVVFKVVQPGRWCHTVQVSGPAGILASQSTCLEAQSETSGSGSSLPSGAAQPGPSSATSPGAIPSPPFSTGPSTPSQLPPSGQSLPGTSSPATASPTLPGGSPGAGVPPPTPATTPSQPAPSSASSTLQSVNFKITGPSSVKLGESAVFTCEITVTGPSAIANLRLRCSFDEAWEPLRASAGYQLEGDVITWTLNTLAPNQPIRRQVELRALKTSEQACCRGELVSPEGGSIKQQACVRIEPAAPTPTVRGRPPISDTLPSQSDGSSSQTPPTETAASGDAAGACPAKVSIIDRYDPIAIGKSKTVEFVVTNSGHSPLSDIRLAVTIPDSFVWDPEMTSTPVQVESPSHGVVVFVARGPLPAGQSLRFRLGLTAKKAGPAQINAQVTCQGFSYPLTVTRNTTVVDR
ncbi:hypothetical protein [Thermogutta sp.]|uniref:hypothetical protein n=1 Tax=Thermogutta sp. TaxID=1962930 RepID=UPI003C7E6558